MIESKLGTTFWKSHTQVRLHTWIYSKDFYGKLCWKFVGRNDMKCNIKIENNKKRAIDSERKEEIPTVEDLK